MAIPQRFGSLTKEPPLARLDATLRLVVPGITYHELLRRARASPEAHPDAPGLLRNRFLTVDDDDRIVYDGLLALISSHGPEHPRVRKIMYFLWAMRDRRIRRFIIERVADASGRWQPRELVNKDNAEFFQEFSDSAGAPRKIRSNIEFFLEEAGIFDPHTRAVHLELDDGWLTDAMSILAAEETDAHAREAMLRDPVGFLFDEGLNALVNLTRDERPHNYPGELDSGPAVDDSELPAGKSAGDLALRKWEPHTIEALKAAAPTATLNLVARERASRAHQALERLAAAAIQARGLEPRFTPLIDLCFEVGGASVIMEMKRCHRGNVHTQIRRAVAQLLEYRYLYTQVLQGDIFLVLVLETAPPAEKEWLTDYLFGIGIFPAWKHPSGDALVSTAEPPPPLAGIVGNAT